MRTRSVTKIDEKIKMADKSDESQVVIDLDSDSNECLRIDISPEKTKNKAVELKDSANITSKSSPNKRKFNDISVNQQGALHDKTSNDLSNLEELCPVSLKYNKEINLNSIIPTKKIKIGEVVDVTEMVADIKSKSLKSVKYKIAKNDNPYQHFSQPRQGPILLIDFIKGNDKAIEFYSGLQSYEKFLLVFKSFGHDVFNLNYYYDNEPVPLTLPDQFFMTLILLKLQKSHYEISILFNISLRDIKNIFITWIKFMSLKWREVNFPISTLKSASKKTAGNVKQNNKVNSNIQEQKDNIIVKDWENLSDTDKNAFKKIYKILNGPANYMEVHLMEDIVEVCHVLCLFKLSKIENLRKFAIFNRV